MASLIIGIDLGATITVASHINAVGEPQLIMNWDNELFTHSGIWFSKDSPLQPVIGSTATEAAGLAEGAFTEYLRDMGTGRVYHAHGRQHTPTELSTLMLRKQREHIENTFGQKIDAVAITTPANFSSEARTATIDAARAAGLTAPILIDAPTAAGLYFAQGSGKTLNGKLLIVNLGETTLDVTVLEAERQSVTVIHSTGVSQLGGKDFDKALRDLISRKFQELTGAAIELADSGFTDFEAEKVKRRLSEVEKHEFKVHSIDHGKVSLIVTREEFEAQIAPLLTQIESSLESAMQETVSPFGTFAGCFIMGEACWIPAVRRSVEGTSGIKPKVGAEDHAPARGAALFAAHMHRARKPQAYSVEASEETRAKRVQDLAPYCLGLIERDWLTGTLRNRVIIKKGDHIPCRREFLIAADSVGTFPEIIFSQCFFETTERDDVTILAEIRGHGAEARPYDKGLLIFEINAVGVFSGRFRDLRTQKTWTVTLSLKPDIDQRPDMDVPID
jgi:molecular chaperone DnaK (HSP70)